MQSKQPGINDNKTEPHPKAVKDFQPIGDRESWAGITRICLRFYELIEKLQSRIAVIEKAFGIFAMAFIIVINVYGIGSRYIFNKPVLFIQELTILCAVWLFFIGMGLVFKLHSDITVEFLVKFLPRRVKMINDLIVDILILIFTIILAFQSAKFFMFLSGQNESHALSFALELPDQIYYIPIGIGAVSIFLTIFHRFIQRSSACVTQWQATSETVEKGNL